MQAAVDEDEREKERLGNSEALKGPINVNVCER